MDDQIEERFRDAFFLRHLQSIKADGAWYQNQKFLGKGGNGTTFLVTCTSGENLGVQFALKVFHKISDEKRRARFLDEVRHYRELTHHSIIGIFDEGLFAVEGGATYPFAVIDYVPSNFEDMLGKGLPHIPRLESIRYLLNVTSGIAYLHNRPEPIIHRDIKPANILVDQYRAKLGDLGLAKVMTENAETGEPDLEPYVAGPYYYRTPELVSYAKGEVDKLTPASDIFQLGLILYRAVTGYNPLRPPKAFADDIELDIRDVHGAAVGRINALIEQSLSVDPSRRPIASVMLDKLHEIHSEVCQADYQATGTTR